MQRKRTINLAKAGVILGVVPVLLWAYEYGPNPGFAGVPGEHDGATCATSGCHVGTPLNAGGGSVTVTFPNGMTYTPGVTQHLKVTIADRAQRAWGFELTARQASSTSTVAGSFASTDNHTQIVCSHPDLFIFSDVPFSGSGSQSCASDSPLQYIEHSRAGYDATRGTTASATYEFDWTPPASNVGNVTIYVAGNAANGDLQPTGDHIYSATYTLTAVSAPATGATPAIDSTLGVQNQTSAPSAAGVAVAPGSLVAIYGSNFATAMASADTIPLSTKLANVSVSFAGIAAPMVGIAPGLKIGSQTVDQINAVVPWGVTPGTVPVVVTANNAASPPLNVSIAATGPGIFYINTDSTGVNRPLAYNNRDNTFAYPSDIFGAAIKSRPTSIANDFLVIWCTGLGAVTLQPPDGAGATNAAGQFVESDTLTKPVVLVGGRQANVLFSGLTQYPSIYQVHVQLDAATPTGDAVPLQIQMGVGPISTDQLKIAVTQ